MSDNTYNSQDIERIDLIQLHLNDDAESFDIEQIIGETLEDNKIFEELVSKIAKGIHDSI